MALPVIFSKSNLPSIITDSPLRAVAVAVPVALVALWLLPWWVPAAVVAIAGWKFYKVVR